MYIYKEKKKTKPPTCNVEHCFMWTFRPFGLLQQTECFTRATPIYIYTDSQKFWPALNIYTYIYDNRFLLKITTKSNVNSMKTYLMALLVIDKQHLTTLRWNTKYFVKKLWSHIYVYIFKAGQNFIYIYIYVCYYFQMVCWTHLHLFYNCLPLFS